MKHLPDILTLQRDLVKKFQNVTELTCDTIEEFLHSQKAGLCKPVVSSVTHISSLEPLFSVPLSWKVEVKYLAVYSLNCLPSSEVFQLGVDCN